TVHKEDIAYTLLGIFNIQIPLIYGKGRAKAWEQLRKEVDQATKPPPIPVSEFDKPQECLQLFRLTNSDRDATYDWYKDRAEDRVEDTCL
ncbi:hypothetical protein GQ53DRAFT_648543, partial [Thozetella sp. PMI_491]